MNQTRQPKPKDADNENDRIVFVELHAPSNFTLLTRNSHPQEYTRGAAEFGLKAIAIANHNSAAGIVMVFQEPRDMAREAKRGGLLETTIPRLLPVAWPCLIDGTELTSIPQDRTA